MSSFTWKTELLCGVILFGLAGAAPSATAQEKASPPDFSSNGVGWVGFNGNGPFFEAVPGTEPPLTQDPAHPCVPTAPASSLPIGSPISPIRTLSPGSGTA
jgi:hypothetical protein